MSEKVAPARAASVFNAEGELAALMSAFDWEKTPLGKPEAWPQSLRAAVRILLSSRFAMWMGWGPELTFLYNDAYAKVTLGAKHPWALGRSARDVWAEVWDQVETRVDQVLSQGTATWDERLLLFLERSGFPEETYHTFSYSPLADDDGHPAGLLCVVSEETERVIGERRLSLLHVLATELAAVGSKQGVLDAFGRCLATDARDAPFCLVYLPDEAGRPELAAATGLPAGHPALSLSAPELGWPLESVLADGAAALSELPASMEWPAGPWPEPPRRAAIVPIAQPGQARPHGVVVVGLNRFRPFDEAYRTYLGLFVAQLSAGLAGADQYEAERRRAEALAELDRAKTAFFSNVSHEFRTPLTLMLGPTEDALSAGAGLAGRELETVHRNMLRLLKLVNTLLEFSRMESGRLSARYRAVELDRLTADLASSFRSAVERAGLGFAVEVVAPSEPVFVDPRMWEAIVLNLLSNALKFTFDGAIELALREPLPGKVELSVRDSGVGIEPAELPRVFERFHRIEGARSRSHEGSGIGLSLVQELVRLHGGSIAVTSEPGVGSAFTVTLPTGSAHLPLERVVEAAEATLDGVEAGRDAFVAEALRWLPTDEGGSGIAMTNGAVTPHDRARILIADDNADMRDYLSRLLAPHAAVETAADGEEALALARNSTPDLIVTDVMMPRLDGFGLLGKLREDAALATVPVIMLSARAGEEARVEGIQSGADDYLVKPFSARELLARVQMRLELARLHRAQAEAQKRLESLATAADSANRAKDEFLAMLGHELRNPLAPMLTALQLMRLRGQSSREQDVLERQVAHLSRLVDDLLDVSRITRGRIELKRTRIELCDVVARALEIASPLLEQSRHELDVQVAPRGLSVIADLDRMAQVVSNLLTNAAKYSDPRSLITVRAARHGETIVLSVRDRGIGISSEMLEDVFSAFVQQPQSLDRSRGGLGLGLAIVRNLVERHGGSVRATSDGVGRGSEFVVELPAAVASDALSPHVANDTNGVETKTTRELRVLVVDDNEDAGEMLKFALESRGYQVHLAHDGPSALKLAAELSPDIALVDIGLPVMDGYELAERLRTTAPRGVPRLLAITGYGQESDRERSRRAGFEAHLVKPLDLAGLERAIEAG